MAMFSVPWTLLQAQWALRMEPPARRALQKRRREKAEHKENRAAARKWGPEEYQVLEKWKRQNHKERES